MLSEKEVKRLIRDLIASISAVRKLTRKRLGNNNPSEIAKILASIDINERRRLLDIDTIDKEINILLTILEEIRSNADDIIVRKALAAKYDKAMKELENAIELMNYFKQLNKLHAQRLDDPVKTITTETTLLKRYETYKERMIADLENRINTVEPILKRASKQPSYLQTGLAKAVILLMGAIAPSCAAETKEEIKIEQPAEHQHTREFYKKLSLEELEEEVKAHPTAAGYVEISDRYGVFFKQEKDADKKQEYITKFGELCKLALSLDDNSSSAHNNLGFFYRVKNQNDFAEKEYLRSLEIDEADEAAHNNIARIYSDKGEYSLALKHFKRVLELNPEHKDAPKWISFLEKKINR